MRTPNTTIVLLNASILVAAWLSSNLSLAQTPEQEFAAALADRDEGRIESAIDRLDSIVASNPEYVSAHVLLATLEATLNRWESAESHIDAAISLAPGDPDVLVAKARISSWRGSYSEADALVDDVLEKFPAYLDALILKARIAYYLDKLDDADEALRRAMRLEPENLEVLIAVGDVRAAQGRIEEAMRSYRLAAGLYPNSQEAAERAVREFERRRFWNAGATLSRSTIDRIPLEDWKSLSAFLSKQLNEKNNLSFQLEHADRYSLYDTQLLAVLNRRFTSEITGYLSLGATPNDDFLPGRTAAAGGDVRWRAGGRRLSSSLIGFDMSRREYFSTSVSGFNLSLRQKFFDDRLQFTYTSINSRESGRNTESGWLARIDLDASAGYRIYAGYADAPESERGVVTNTVSAFAGFGLDLTEALSVRVDYARHDRAESYLRRDFAVGFNFRF